MIRTRIVRIRIISVRKEEGDGNIRERNDVLCVPNS